MKKLFLFGVICLLAACNNTVKPVDNVDSLKLVESEPKNCVFLYKMNAVAEFYSRDDAVQYLKNQIADQHKSGNVIWLERIDKVQKEWVMFGPEYKYDMVARVYDCAKAE